MATRASTAQLDRSDRARPLTLKSYLQLSRQPLHILVFLLPLLLLYEFGSFRYLPKQPDGSIETISAFRMLVDFFAWFGIDTRFVLYLPGLALVTVFLVWQLLVRDPWRVRIPVVLLLWLESCVLTIPLLVLSQIVARLEPAAVLALQEGSPLTGLSNVQRLIISIGAGLYEELLFRMVAIGAMLLIFVDLFRMKRWVGNAAAVVISAALFTLYHHPWLPDGSVDWPQVMFLALSGTYFGVVFLGRGFGVVVAAHAVYDAVVLLLLPIVASSA
jgi:membrane protease YdiL (CAAX protease family)